MSNVVYTIRRENDGLYTALILEPNTKNVIDECEINKSDLENFVEEKYNATYVPKREFQEELYHLAFRLIILF